MLIIPFQYHLKRTNLKSEKVVYIIIGLPKKTFEKIKKITDIKNEAKKIIKSDNNTRSNREKSNIAIAILKEWKFESTKII